MNDALRKNGMHPRRLLAVALVAAAASANVTASADTYVASPEAQQAAITSWWDTSRNTQFVAYVSSYGSIIVLTCGNDGCWRVSAADPVPGVYPGGLSNSNPPSAFFGGSSLTGYFDGNEGHLFFIGFKFGPETLEYEHVGDLWEEHIDATGHWSGQSITAATGATQPWNGGGQVYAPYLMSSLSSLFAQNRQHVFYAGATDSRIHDAYFDGAWHDVAITGSFTAPPFIGLNLTSYYDGFEHVYAAGQEVYASCDECGWMPGSAPALSFGYVVGETHDGVENLYGSDGYSSLQDEYFYGGWYPNEQYAANYNGFSPLLVYEDNSDISPRGFYVGGDQHIYQMWNDEDITAETGAVPAAEGSDDDALSPITGYYDGINDHVFYIGSDQHVHELYMSSTTLSGGWLVNDLTVSANATNSLPALP